jgi:hypothetical protein
VQRPHPLDPQPACGSSHAYAFSRRMR